MLKYFCIIIIAIIFLSCNSSKEFVGNSLNGTWREIHPKGSFFLGGDVYSYIFTQDSFKIKQRFLTDSWANHEEIKEGKGIFTIKNDSIYLKGYYKVEYEYVYFFHSEFDSIMPDPRGGYFGINKEFIDSEKIYNVGTIPQPFRLTYKYDFMDDTLVFFNEDDKWGRYFIKVNEVKFNF